MLRASPKSEPMLSRWASGPFSRTALAHAAVPKLFQKAKLQRVKGVLR